MARVHYKKLESRAVAEKAKQSMDKLRNNSNSVETIQKISESINIPVSKTDAKIQFSINPKEKERDAINNKEKQLNNRQKKLLFQRLRMVFSVKG